MQEKGETVEEEASGRNSIATKESIQIELYWVYQTPICVHSKNWGPKPKGNLSVLQEIKK